MPTAIECEQLPVADARTGNAAAWEALFRRYRLPIYAYVFELLEDEQTSLDVVQETFLNAFRHLSSLRDDHKFGSWLFSIAHQNCLGEHNDMLRQMVRPIENRQGTLLGFIGVSYAVNPATGFPGFGYAIPLFLIPIGCLVYWLALAWWVWLDARTRGERAWVWTCFVLLGNLAALMAYLLTRHSAPTAFAGHPTCRG